MCHNSTEVGGSNEYVKAIFIECALQPTASVNNEVSCNVVVQEEDQDSKRIT